MAEDELYDVETIIEKKLENGVEKFKTRWKDCPPEEDTWEPEDSFEDSYDLILWFEQTEFFQKSSKQPAIEGLKIYNGRFKLLIHWKKIGEQQYYYSNAVAQFDPNLVISFYETLIASNSTTDFEYNSDAPTMIKENQRIENVITFILIKRKRIFLVSIKDEDEAVFVDAETIKSRCPLLLIDFYERNIHSAA